MVYQVVRDKSLDFTEQSYSTLYPNLHKYPATMLPQIGIALLKRLNIKEGNLLDPYCGSGSSFAAALDVGIDEMYGFDINPLAVLISKAKFTKISKESLEDAKNKLRENVFEFAKYESNLLKLKIPKITNITYWFSKNVLQNLNILKYFIYNLHEENIRNFFLVPYSETIRECSYTRNSEFKLYRMKSEDILSFNPDVFGVFLKKLNEAIYVYSEFYLPKLKSNTKIDIEYAKFNSKTRKFDTVLTSPPYGDSRTTVAYGQFSTLSNEWMGIDYARKIDSILMGGKKSIKIYNDGIISDYINRILKIDNKRALEVSSFYSDLELSISEVAQNIKKGGKIIYLVGNRTVKEIQLPTDQFIAEKFDKYGFKHLVTYERALSSKVMPSKNSPTNKKGAKVNTMLFEYIIISEKVKEA
jgi:predicted RNA methylase